MKLTQQFLLASLAIALPVFGARGEENGFSIPVMRVSEAPKIDADLTDEVWTEIARSHAGVFSGWTFSRGKSSKLADQQRVAYVGYDDTHLYVAMQAYATDIYTLTGGSGGNAFVGECVEIFVKPDGEETFHVGIDVEENINVGLKGKAVDVKTIRYKTGFGENYWAMEAAIPWSTIGVVPERGKVLGFNLGANKSQQYGAHAVISWGANFGDRQPMPTIQLK